VLAPYFKANGIYPLFVTWHTGFADSIAGILEDKAKSLGIDLELMRSRGLFDDLREAIIEASDRAFEAAAERILAKAVWTQMKQNAEAAASGGALGLLATHLQRLQQAKGDLEIHLIGHSAGAILLGHLLERLIGRNLAARSLTLYAPACTVAFASRHYGKAFDKKALDPAALTVELLSDEREQEDTVGPYGKSLLYLVSRALEEVHKMPLLGLAAAWDASADDQDVFHRQRRRDIGAWLELWGSRPKPRVVSAKQVSDGQRMINASHGSFDNNVEIVADTLKRIRGKALQHRVENLRGF
jgi:pimeloyl-ACP methyl ester carboxylesterase